MVKLPACKWCGSADGVVEISYISPHDGQRIVNFLCHSHGTAFWESLSQPLRETFTCEEATA